MKKLNWIFLSLGLAATVTACGYAHKQHHSPQFVPYTSLGESMEDSPEHNTEDYDHIDENPFADPLKAPYSTFSIDVDAASYANTRRFLLRDELPPIDAVRTEEFINYFDYDYPQPTDGTPFSITTEVAACPWNPQHQLVHIGLQGKVIPAEALPASNLVFLLDVSGSMDEPNKLPLVKKSLAMLSEEMRPQDRVAIVVYAGAAGLVLASTPGDRRAEIIAALESLNAGGSTAGGEGILLAYQVARENFIQGGNNRIILATDGDFNVGVSDDGSLERLVARERESGVFLTVLGFGTGNYKDNKMQTLAEHGNGNNAYIDNIMEARKVLVHEMGGTLHTIAKDVKIQVEFNPAEVQQYRLIGYESRLLAAEDFNDDAKDAGELGAGHSVTALYEVVPVGVTSANPSSVDPLRYQSEATTTPRAGKSGELFQIKFRYKEPDGNESRLITTVQPVANVPFAQASENFRWSAAVAEFGMLLRQSPHAGDATYAACKEIAQQAIGRDTEGYRGEFVSLVKRAELLDQRAPVARR